MNPTWWIHTAPEAGLFLLGMALKSALLIAGLLLADRFLGDRRASWRNLLWIASLVGLVLIPLASAWGPALRVPVFAEAEPMVAAVQSHPLPLEVPEGTGAPLQADPSVSLPGVAEVTEPRAVTWGWTSILVLVYGAGVCFFVGRMGVGVWYIANLRRQTQEVKDARFWPVLQELRDRLGIRRFVRLGTSEKVGSPLQVGVFSPLVILPSRLVNRLDDQTFRAVAAHELAHVRRWDYLLHLLAMVVLAFHWFNPLAWLAVRRLHETGEHACDEWAVRLIGKYEVYARVLLDVLGDMRGQRLRWGLGMAYQAEERLERIMELKNAIPAGVSRWVRGGVLASVAMGAVVLGCSAALASKQSPLPGGGKIAYGLSKVSYVGEPKPGAKFTIGPQRTVTVIADGTDLEIPPYLQGGIEYAWSADGRKVAFVVQGEDGSKNIYIVNADGTDKLKLTNGTYTHGHPSLSANGEIVAFHRGVGNSPVPDSSYEVCTINADGTSIHNLSRSPGIRDWDPAISPDGKWVAFSSNRLYQVAPPAPGHSPPEGVVFLVDTDGNNLHPLTSTTGVDTTGGGYPSPNYDWDSAWSPDGKHIAWSDGSRIWVMNADGTQPRLLADGGERNFDRPTTFSAPAWSPDGTKIAMSGMSPVGKKPPYDVFWHGTICVMDADGSNLHLLTDYSDMASNPQWMPVGGERSLGPR